MSLFYPLTLACHRLDLFEPKNDAYLFNLSFSFRPTCYPLLIDSIGKCSEDDWLELARPNIIDRMAAYEEDHIEFSILGLVRDPLPDLIKELASNVRQLEVLNARLLSAGCSPAVQRMLEELNETLLGPDLSYELTRADIDAATLPQEESISSCPVSELPELHKKLRDEQQALRGRIREEQQTQRSDDDHATGRRYDYGPAVRTWLRFLARKQLLAELLK